MCESYRFGSLAERMSSLLHIRPPFRFPRNLCRYPGKIDLSFMLVLPGLSELVAALPDMFVTPSWLVLNIRLLNL